MNLRPGRPRPSPLPLLVTLSERLQRSTSEVLERRERRLAVVLATLIIALTLTTAGGSAADERGPQDRMIEPSPATTSETTTAHNATAGATHSPATEAGFPLYMRLIATLACLVIFTVGVCGNLLVPLVVIKTKYLRNSTNLFLINLSIADLLVLIVCMPTVLIELHSRPETWLLGEAMCKLSNFIEMLAANGSIFTILAISFERYYAICKPLKAGYKCTRLRATIIICFIWLLSCILTSPILIMAKSSETIYIDGSLVYNCILETDTYWPKMYVFVSMFAFFCLPLLVLMLVYWLISRRLIRENVAMMDTNRENLVDSRSNTRLENNSHSAYISSSHISSVFKRHPERIHRTPLLSLLKSKQYRDNQCGKVDSAQILSNYSNQKLNSDSKKINAVLLAHANKTRSFAIRPASMMNSLHREKMKNGKALSLDCHEAIIKNDYEHNDSETCEPQSETGPLSRAHSNSQSYWSSRIVADSNPTNYPSSSADASTSVTVTSSSEHSEERIRSRNEPSEGTKAYFGRLFFANLKSLGQLLKQANLTPLLSSSERSKSGSQSRNGHSGVDVNEVGSKPDYNPVPISRDDDITVAEMNMSSTSYANRLVDPGEPDSGGRNRASNIEQESLDNAHVRPQSTNAISRSGHEVLTAAGRECQTGEPHHGHSPHNGKRLAKVASVKLRRCESDTRTEARRASLIAQPKRLPEGNNKCARESRGSAQAKSRSKFKWVKGFSISSSTGSTYTNSTCLPSETGSASPSLHISRQQNSPSPPRAFKLRHASRRSTATDAEFVSGSREHSPDKMMLASRKRTAHFDAPRKDQLENGRANSPHSRRMSHTRAHIGQGSRSSSLMHNETENACFSDASSSSSLSIEGESSAKPSWLEALVFQEQQNYQDPQLFSQLQQQLAQQRRLSLQGEDQFSATDLESNNSVFKSFNEQSLPHYAEGPMCAQHLEVVDEDETMNSSTNDDGSSPAEVNVRRKTLEVQSNKQSMVKTRVRRSLTETHDDDHCAERVNQAGANGKRPKHDSDCYEHIDMNSSQHRIMSKINLIAMAHSLTDNLHYKRTGRRFGSHPVISNRTHLVGAEINRDFIAVRDISKKQQMDSRRQVVAMLAFVVACFFLLFFPYRVFTIWLILSTEDQVQSLGMETYYNLTYFSRILIYLHSAINPIAYNLISTKFRRAFMSILLCRGAATRRNFNIDYRHQQEPKCHVNNESRLKVAYKSSKN